jgi:hypothetical protein
MVKIDGLVPGEKHCSGGSLRARTSSPCGASSVPNTCRAAGPLATTHEASEEVEGIRPDFMGDGPPATTPSLNEWEGAIAGTSTGPGPLGGCRGRRPLALCEGYVPARCERFLWLYTHFEAVLAITHVVHGRLASHFCVAFEG